MLRTMQYVFAGLHIDWFRVQLFTRPGPTQHWIPTASQESACSVEPGSIADVQMIVRAHFFSPLLRRVLIRSRWKYLGIQPRRLLSNREVTRSTKAGAPLPAFKLPSVGSTR